MTYSAEERRVMVTNYAEAAKSSDLPLTAISEKFGGVTIPTIYKWADNDPELGEIWYDALAQRAFRYQDKAEMIAENVNCRWVAHTSGTSGKGMIDIYEEKEAMTAVNAARLRIERCDQRAAQLAPQFFSPLSKEVKEIQKKLGEISKALDENGNKK